MLDQSGIDWSKRKNMIKWSMSHKKAINAIDFGSTMEKVDRDHVNYMEQLQFSINLKSRTSVKEVIMRRDTETGIIEGYDSLNE